MVHAAVASFRQQEITNENAAAFGCGVEFV